MENLAYVGTYTSPPQGDGIVAIRQDRLTGKLTIVNRWPNVLHPSFICRHPSGAFLFAVNESGTRGQVSSFAIERATGCLTFLSMQPTEGGAPCHLTTDRAGRLLFVANHNGGTIATLPIQPNGSLGTATDIRQHEGRGPGPTQEAPHAHSVDVDPSGRFLLCCDKGIDRVMVYRIGEAAPSLSPAPKPFAELDSGTAPRHLAFHPDGQRVYVLGEADLSITVFRWDAAEGRLDRLDRIQTLPAAFQKPGTTGAEITVHPSGKFLFSSLRGVDLLVAHRIQDGGRLIRIGDWPSGGKTPRHFSLDPAGRFLYAANQDSGNLAVFRVDGDTGRLDPTGESLAIERPVCVSFAA